MGRHWPLSREKLKQEALGEALVRKVREQAQVGVEIGRLLHSRENVTAPVAPHQVSATSS